MSAIAPLLRILHLEDDEADALLVARALRKAELAAEVTRVDDAAGLRAAIEAGGPWDVVLADYSLPAINGVLAVRLLLQERGLDVPVIVVSGTIGEEAAVEAMRAGARDYVMKGALRRLAPAIRREVAEAAERRERRRAEATLREAEEQVRRLQKMDAIGRVAAGIAHDFNNVLQATWGYAQLIAGDPTASPTVQASVQEMMAVQDHAAGLVRQLMAFARRQELRPVELDLNEAVREMELMLRSAIAGRATLRLELAAARCLVRVDRGQLGQVLMNLVLNARDAVGRAGTIRIVTAPETPQAGRPERLVLEVRDDGPGIPPEVMPRLFEPFFTTKPAGEGTGLGLPTVFGIVTQSGGEVQVESAPGEGATFRILLPASPPA